MKAPLLPMSVCAGLLLAACQVNGQGAPGPAVMAAPVGAGNAVPASTAESPANDAGTTATDTRGAASADPGITAQTAAERRADLDGRFDASLDSFDEKLRRERQRSASERDNDASSRADGAVVDATSSGERDRDDLRRDRSGDLQSTGVDRQSDATGASGQGTGNGSDARPIPSGVDDDIIARRLRRAAETETDPELKEKLWDEYRDYKENTKGGK